MKKYDSIIIGGGPAGLTAAIYLGRARFNVLVIKKEDVGSLISAHKIDNYPGFSDGITGKDLYFEMKKQAEKFGAEFEEATFLELDYFENPKKVKTSSSKFEADTIIIATGWLKNSAKKYKGEEEFLGKGVSYCATCDGAFTRQMTVSVFGNGDEAMQEALFLTRYAKEILFFIQEDELSGENELIKNIKSSEKIKLIKNTNLIEISGSEFVEKVLVNEAGQEKEYETAFTFLYLGTKSSLELFAGFANLNEKGYIITDEKMNTKIDGIYAAGDIRHKELRQVTTAVADGSIAGMEAVKYLMKLKKERG